MVPLTPATINTLNTLMFLGFSVVAATVSGIIKQNHWPDWQNQLIVFVVGALCAVGYVWVDSSFVGNVNVWLGSLSGAMVIVLSRFEPLIKWSEYLQASVVLLKGAEPVPPVVVETSLSAVPAKQEAISAPMVNDGGKGII